MNPWTAFDTKWGLPAMPGANEPVFLLASIWRSGSTLVQRLLCSDPQLFLWGEPYGDAGILPHLHQSARGLLREEWPTIHHFLDPQNPAIKPVLEEPYKYWIANTYPKPYYMRQSYRSMLDTLFLDSVQEMGKTRFGIKEVRYDGQVAQFIQWLYPDARFVFLLRNPYDAWSSYKEAAWYYQWPKMLVKDVLVFSKLWRKNVESFLEFPDTSNSIIIRLEDITSDIESHLTLLEEHCRVSIKREALNIKIRGMEKPALPVTEKEEAIIRKTCGDLATNLGYFAPKNTGAKI